MQNQIIAINDDWLVIERLKQIDMLKTFDDQIERIKHLKKQMVIFKYTGSKTVEYFIRFIGFDLATDNGYIMYSIPTGQPEIEQLILDVIKENTKNKTRVLWIDGGPAMNN